MPCLVDERIQLPAGLAPADGQGWAEDIANGVDGPHELQLGQLGGGQGFADHCQGQTIAGSVAGEYGLRGPRQPHASGHHCLDLCGPLE